jgi:hypothetical protein
MTVFDHSRRAASVLLVVLCLLVVPAVATAKFTSSKPVPLKVGTATMGTPSNFDGSYKCTKTGNTENFEVTITNFAYTGPATSTYGYGLALGNTIKDTGTSSTKTQTLNSSKSYDGQSTTWTFGAQAYLNEWYGGIASVDIICPANATKTGTF